MDKLQNIKNKDKVLELEVPRKTRLSERNVYQTSQQKCQMQQEKISLNPEYYFSQAIFQ